MTETNRYAPPEAAVADIAETQTGRHIETLPVSEAWKHKFRLIDKAGGPKLPKLKELTGGERSKIGFGFLAFLFGPVYYLVKGMWKKALTLFAIGVALVVVLTVVMDLAGFGQYTKALGYAVGAIFAVRANIDYYKKMVLGDNGWW